MSGRPGQRIRPRNAGSAAATNATSCRPQRRAYSLVEVMICVLIVGGLFVAALQTLSAARVSQRQTTQRSRAQMLAQAMIEEIVTQPYLDPQARAGFGPEPDETDDETRRAFDDVDDYHKWTATPPETATGAALDGFAGWTRRVAVHHADPNRPEQSMQADTGLKRIVVTVKHRSAVLAKVAALRSRAWPDDHRPELIKP